MSDVNPNTPVADVINSRPQIIRLAQAVFDVSTPSAVRAFGQFPKSPDLGRLIDAKRSGTFNYGGCITDGPTGLKWPTDTALILGALEKAEKGELTLDDVIPLFGGDKTLAETQFPKIMSKPVAAPAKTKKVEVKKQEKTETKTEEKVVAKTEETKVLPFKQKEEPKAEQVVATAHADQRAGVDISAQVALVGQGLAQLRDEANNSFVKIGVNLVDNFENTQGMIRSLFSCLEIVVANQVALNANLKTLADYTDPSMEFVPTLTFDNVAAKPTPAPVAEQVAPPREVVAAVKADPVVVEKLVEVLPPEPEAKASDSEVEIEVTEELLQRLDIGGLRDLAAKLGIKGGDKIGYPGVARKKIRAAVGLSDVKE